MSDRSVSGKTNKKKWVHDEVQRGREKSKPNGKSEGEPIFDLPKGAWESGRGIAFSAGSYITKKTRLLLLYTPPEICK